MSPHLENTDQEIEIKTETIEYSENITIKEEKDIFQTFHNYEKRQFDVNDDFAFHNKKIKTEVSDSETEDDEDVNIQTIENQSTAVAAEDQSNIRPFNVYKQYCKKCTVYYNRPVKDLLRKCTKCNKKLLFECQMCSRQYRTKGHIRSHLYTKYDCRKKPDLHCDYCDYTSIHKGFLKNHLIKKHIGGLNDLKACSKCGRHFKRRINLDEHEISCGLLPYLECPYCDFKTPYRISFKVHLTNHIVDPLKGAGLIDEHLQVLDTVPECPLSWKPGDSTAVIQEKLNQKCKKYIDVYCRNIIKLYCFKCKETTSVRREKLSGCKKCSTQLLHECGFCTRKFNSFPNMMRHLREGHGGEDFMNTYICGFCDRKYESYKMTVRHESRCGKLYQCDICKFKASVPSRIEFHKKKWHTGENKDKHHPCPKCGRHMRFYADKSNVECGHCR